MRASLIIFGLALLADVSPAYAKDIFVDQANNKFSQTALTVNASDTVHFLNKDSVVHDIRIKEPDGSVNDKGVQKPGEDIKYTFTEPGQYLVDCSIHKGMKLVVTVK